MPVLVTLSLSAALLCFNGSCHRALVGDTTPTGTYPLTPQPTAQPGYRGDVLLFRADPDGWFAVHRTWPGREKNVPLDRRAPTTYQSRLCEHRA